MKKHFWRALLRCGRHFALRPPALPLSSGSARLK
jgi:hypothetical protein